MGWGWTLRLPSLLAMAGDEDAARLARRGRRRRRRPRYSPWPETKTPPALLLLPSSPLLVALLTAPSISVVCLTAVMVAGSGFWVGVAGQEPWLPSPIEGDGAPF
ncbi:hypothetical protein ACLOJK_036543 [Asimina triloba]